MKKLCLFCLMTLLALPAFSFVRYVNASRPDDAGDGLTWATAHKSLQTALSAATTGDQIWVASGIYTPTNSTTNRDVSFAMKEGVAIYGGFSSGQTNLTDRNADPATNGTMLSGDIDGDGTLAGNSYHVFNHDGTGLTGTAILDGFVITGGNANGPSASHSNQGGGMYIGQDQGDPQLVNCLFRGNSATQGGAVYVWFNNKPQFIRCTFTGNTGGAISIFFGSPRFTDCIFQENTAGAGGAIVNERGFPVITNCSFLNNSTTGSGGAIFNLGGGDLQAINCSFQANTAAVDGGAMVNDNVATANITNCSFQGNTATGKGKAIASKSKSTIHLTNCVLWNNGGASTFYKDPSSFLLGPTTLTVDYSLFEPSVTNFTGANNRTTTLSPFVSATDTRLRPGSPAIDAGLNSANATTTDLAGNARVVNGVIDMGAYEFTDVTAPAVRYVNASRPDDAGNGLTWATAHRSLQTALAAARAGDQIWVASGTYTPTTSTTDREAAFIMKEGVAMYGGFSSGQTNLTDRNADPATNGTILSGDIDGDGTLAGNSSRVFSHDGTGLTAAAILDGFVITGGVTPAMYNRNSSPKLANCLFMGNANRAMRNINSSPQLTHCTFLNNSGGAMDNSNSSPELTNCLFKDNSAGLGGAMVNSESSSPKLTNCSFENNSAATQGGAMFNSNNSNVELLNCTFRNNRVIGNPNSLIKQGGAMFIIGSSPQLTNCLFVNNSAGDGGALLVNNSPGLRITNCTFRDNAASTPGGAILAQGAGLNHITNAVFWNNGGSNTLYGGISATYSLFDESVTGYTGSNNLTITVSPFASATDSRLRPGSPAIDAGVNSANATATDLAGNARTFNGTIDMGAYEFSEEIGPTDFAITGVSGVSCAPIPGEAARRLTFTPTYAGTDGSPIRFEVQNETLPTTAPGPYTLKVYLDNPAITLRASQGGGSSVSFRYGWLATCGTTPTDPTNFAITGVSGVTCAPVPGEAARRLTFTPTYAGTDGSPISFNVQNETLPTTASGPYTLKVYLDNPAINLQASQGSGPQVSFRYDWLAACGTSSAKLGVNEETSSKLQVTLLGNPTSGEVEFEVHGVPGQPLELRLLSADGRQLFQRQIERAETVEHHRLSTQIAGVLLLRIDTPTESRTIKVLNVR